MSRYYSSSKTTTRTTCPYTLAARTLAAAILEAAKAAGMKIKAKGSCRGLDRPYVLVTYQGVTYLVTAGGVNMYSGMSSAPRYLRGVASDTVKCVGDAINGRIPAPAALNELVRGAYLRMQEADPEWDGNFSRVFYPYD